MCGLNANRPNMIQISSSQLQSGTAMHPNKSARRSHAHAGGTMPTRWWVFPSLLGLVLWAVHFGRAMQYDGSNYPHMSAAFEMMFNYGRYVALFFMVVALFFYTNRFRRGLTLLSSGPASWIAVLNFYITLKLLIYGNVDFFFGATAVIMLSVFVFVSAVQNVEQVTIRSGGNQESAVALAFWICGALIVLSNIAALTLHPDSATNGERMHGATINAQHLAMMCALTAPSFLFAISRSGIVSIIGIASLVLFAGAVFIEFSTGSRMGFAAIVIGSLVFFRDYIIGSRLFYGVLAGLLVASVVVMALSTNELVDLVYGKFVEGRVDSRSEVWDAAWEAFLDNPLFGPKPDIETGRALLVENSFLAAAIGGGTLAVALFFGIVLGIVQVLQGVRFALRRGLVDRALGNFYLSSIAILLAVSTFEAAIFGIFATHTMIAYSLLAGAAALASQKPLRVPGHEYRAQR